VTPPLAHKASEVAARVSESVKTEVHRVDFGLRVIIVWKAVKAVLLYALGIAAFALVHSDVAQLGEDLVAWFGIDAGRPTVQHALAKLGGLTPHRISVIGIGAILYATVMALEGWGLHQRKRWAEWLTVIVTSSLIPLEIYELIKHPSLGKVIALVVNVAIVLYLLRHKWLFRR
jgi:uncharacterized membrane protein (DUF2068 family)